MSEIEKYLHKQLELQGKRTQNLEKKRLAKNKNVHHSSKSANKSDKYKEGRKSKKRKKDSLESEKDESSEPEDSNHAQETRHKYADDASGSEFVPSDSDYQPSSGGRLSSQYA